MMRVVNAMSAGRPRINFDSLLFDRIGIVTNEK